MRRWVIEVAQLEFKQNGLGEFLKLYVDRWIERQVRKRFPSLDDAQVADVCQEVCLRVVRMRPTELADVKSVQALVFVILGNLAIDELRRLPRDRRRQDIGGSDLELLNASLLAQARRPEDETLGLQLDQALLRAQTEAVAALGPKCRQVWKMHVEQELTQSEIARALGISEKTVANHLWTANKRILKAQKRVRDRWLEGRHK